MKIAFKSNTIRRRIKIFFLTLVLVIGLLGTVVTVNIFTMKANLAALEDFFILSNNVLELRRFEKNFYFGQQYEADRHDYNQIVYYLNTIEMDTKRLSASIMQTVGAANYETFQEDMQAYRANLSSNTINQHVDTAQIRLQGKAMVDFIMDIVTLKRRQIHMALQHSLIVFLTVTVSGVVLLVAIFTVQTQNILRRLTLIERATRQVGKGIWQPIEDQNLKKDEISDLIQAFNKMIQEISTKQNQLIQSEKLAAIGTFSSGVAHELNNPLNNISLTADTLQEEYGALSEIEFREMIADISRQTERASSVVKNLLDFCRNSSPDLAAALDLRQVLSATIKLIGNQLRMESITLETDFPENLPLVRGDFKQLQQVFLNFFLNSIYSISGSGLIVVDARCCDNNFIQVDFSDTGCGIPEEAQRNIFDPFFTTKPVGQGTGLGLSIVHNIIRTHGGYIELHSRDGFGTTFSIFLPAINGMKNGI